MPRFDVCLDERLRLLWIPMLAIASSVSPRAAQAGSEKIAPAPTNATDEFYQRAVSAEAKGDYESAIRDLRAAVQLSPQDDGLHTALGAAFFQEGYLADAIREFHSSIALRPDGLDARSNLAAAWIRLGDPRAAIPELERIVAADPNDRQSRNDLGLCYLQAGRWSDAATEYKLLLKLDPDSPELLYNLALTQKHLEDFVFSRQLLLKCLQLRPSFPAAELELGEAYWQEGMLDEAADRLRSLCRTHPEFLAAYFPLAEVLRQKGDLDGAFATAQAILHADPQSASAYQELAILEQQRGNADAAAAAFHQAEVRKNKAKLRQAAQVADGTALRLLRSGDREAAIHKLEFAIRLDSQYAEAHYHLAIALDQQHDEARSLSEFKKAHAIDARLKPPLEPESAR